MVNGKCVTHLMPSRDLRQGRPLSLYLFIHVADILSKGIAKKVGCSELLGLKMKSSCPTLSLFANDSLFFVKAKSDDFRKIVKLLQM